MQTVHPWTQKKKPMTNDPANFYARLQSSIAADTRRERKALRPSDATACSRVFGDCDCDEQIPSDDYVCEKCELDVTICAECHTIIAGCECGHCPDGATFCEND